ncbi:MAG TPA: RNA-binding S4 domain-containing protein [Gemmatimonadales bacterium]
MAVRIDKWLWAARFFKTRSLATAAVAGGKAQANGERAKPARLVRVGDRLRVRVGSYEYVVIVRALAERRGSAREAAVLYEETPESRAARQRLVDQHRLAPSLRFAGRGRPTKKDRRSIDRMRDDAQD